MNREFKKTILQLLVVLFLGGLVLSWSYVSAHMPSKIDATAKSIVADCSDLHDKATCYETEVPSLYPKMDALEIFDVLRKIRKLDTSYQFCHVAAHKVGGRIVAEDPNKWMDALRLNPTDG